MRTAPISASASGDTTILPAITGKRYKILAYILSSSGTNNIVWKSGTTALSGSMNMIAGGNIAIHLGDQWPSGGLPVLTTELGDAFIINLSASNIVGGHITYVEVSN